MARAPDALYDFQEQVLRQMCITFIIKLVESLRKRLPTNIGILRHIKNISVGLALRVVKPDLNAVMMTMKYDATQITAVSMQWKNLTLVPWNETGSTMAFWAKVKNHRNAAGVNPFHELADLAIHLLALPFSNADVERVFSQMNLVKSKIRNRMQGKLLNAILNIRFSLSRDVSCCHDYKITSEIVEQVGSKSIYDHHTLVGDIIDDDCSILDVLENEP